MLGRDHNKQKCGNAVGGAGEMDIEMPQSPLYTSLEDRGE